jgi:hypothetical protein
MTLEEYQKELRHLSECFAEQNRQFHRASQLLGEHPDALIDVDPSWLAEFDQVTERSTGAVIAPADGVRC